MRRLVPALVLLLAVALAPAALGAKTPTPAPPGSWAGAQIAAVVGAGLIAPSAAEFRPDDALTEGELAEVLAGLGTTAAAPADPSRHVTVTDLDAALVRALGLAKAAKQFRSELAAAGLEPPARAGTEIVARALGLRTNHSNEALELGPNDPVTRAETAFSVARALELSKAEAWEVANLQAEAASFALPELGDWQRRVLTRAVSLLGWPYVWAGSSEKRQLLGGGKAPGGFDCSGFVWRVYKLEPYEGAAQLADVLEGRTTYVMSAEVPAAQRIARSVLAPADVLFFGDKGPKSKPAQVGHMGIHLGNGWMIHSSSHRGVMVVPLAGWYEERFAWARRPLAEAGLVTAPPAPEPAPVEEAAAGS